MRPLIGMMIRWPGRSARADSRGLALWIIATVTR